MPAKQTPSKEKSSQPENRITSEDLLQLLETMGQGVVNLSPDGRIVTTNQSAEKILGLSAQELDGRKLTDLFWDIIHEDGSHFTEDQHPVMVAARTGETVSNIKMGIRSQNDEKYRWVNITAKPTFHPGQNKPHEICVVFLAITEHKLIENRLNERKKELQAFYAITEIAELNGVTLDYLYQRTIDFLPKSWQYPDISCCRIRIDGKDFTTENFKETPWIQSAPIKVDETVMGSIEIGYLTECPPEDEGPFLQEERLLLNSIAERVGRIIERKQTAEVLAQKTEFIELALQAANLGTWQQYFDKNMMVLDEIARLHYGFSTNTVTEKDIIGRIHPDDLQRFIKYYQTAVEKGTTDSINTDHRIIHPDGTIKWLEVHAKIKFIRTEAGLIPWSSVGTSQDITERKLAEGALDRKTRSLHMLSTCNQALIKITNENELLQEICRICVEDGGYRLAWVGYAEENPEKNVRPMAESGFEAGYLKSTNITWADNERGNGPTGTAIRTNRPSIAQNIQHDPRFTPWRAAAIQRGYGSSIALPLNLGGKTIGAFMLYAQDPDSFQPEEIDLLVELADDLSFGIQAIRTRANQTQIEQELIISERRYKLAQRSAQIGSWEWDMLTDSVFWSDEMYMLFDKKPVEFSPTITAMLDCVVPEDKQRTAEVFEAPLSSEVPFDVEFRILDSGGRIKWLNSKGNIIRNSSDQPVMTAGTMQDITDAYLSQQALRQSEETQHALLEAITESVLLIKSDGTGIMANSKTLERLKITREEFKNHNIFEILPAEVAAIRKKQAEMAVHTRQPVRFEDTRFGRHILNSINPIIDLDGHVSQLAIFGFDITDLKKAQHEILRLSRVVEQVADTIIVTDVKGAINYVNPSFEKLTGYSLQEVIGKSPNILKSGSQPDGFYKDLWQKILNGMVFEGEFLNRKKNGELFYEIKTITPVTNAQGEVTQFIATGKDITDRKAAEVNLLASEHRSKILIDAIPDMLFRIKRDGTIIDYHGKRSNKLYAPPEFFIGKKVGEVLPADVSGQIVDAVNKAFIEKTLQTIEYTLIVGEEPSIFEGRVVASDYEDEAVMTVRDITQQKQMELELRENEEKYRVLMESLDTVVTAIDHEGKLLYLNDVGANMLEGKPEDFEGKTLFECFPPQVAESQMKSIQAVFDQNKSSVHEAISQVKSGPRWFRTTFVPIHDGTGKVVSVLVNSTDIHDLKTAQQNLLELNRSLEDKVIERTAELQDLYDNAPTGYHSLDATGTFQFINSTELNWLGYTKDEVIGKLKFSDLSIPEELSKFHDSFDRFKKEGRVRNEEFTLQRKDGSLLPVEINSTAIFDDEGNFLKSRSTMIDNTERKKSREEMERSEATYRALFEKSNDGVFLIAPDGREMAANQQALNMIGYTAEEYNEIKNSLNDAIVPEEEQLDAWARFEAVLRGETVPLYERAFITKSGKKIDTEVNLTAIRDEKGKIIFVQSVVRDITQRKAIDAELRRVNNLSDTALDLARAGYWYIPLDGSGVFISSDRVINIQGDEFHADYRYDLQADLNKQIEAANPEMAIMINQRIEDAVSGKTDRFDFEFQYKRPKDGRIIWIRAIGNVLFESDGNATGIIGVSQDITLQKQMEIDLHTAKESAETANKAKSVFLANMSHEIRTPMNAILGFGQILLKDQDLNAKNRNYLEIINRSGEHLLALINEILEMSKIEAGHVSYNPTTFNFPLIIQDLRSMFDLRLAAKNLTMTVEMAPNIPEYIISDENKVKEILINLIGNAVKFTSKGGLSLRCRAEKDPLSSDPKNLFLFIDVEDTGMGISPDDIPKLFKAFEQTRSGAQMIGGTGLGLAISQNHARLLGGDITITSTPGVGSCFHVKLAVQESDKAESGSDLPSRQVTGIKPGTKAIRVLIADDHEENRLVLRELLEPLGILTQGAENGKIALEIAIAWKPDLILMDLRMPIMNGFEAAKKIKETTDGKNIHIVAVTASILELDKYKVNESGMTGYLRKPFKEYELFAILESKLGSIFTYNDHVITAKDMIDPEPMTPESMAVIPRELIDHMEVETTKANFEKLVALIDKVSAFSPQIAHKLRSLADDYQYDSLLKLFKKGE